MWGLGKRSPGSNPLPQAGEGEAPAPAAKAQHVEAVSNADLAVMMKTLSDQMAEVRTGNISLREELQQLRKGQAGFTDSMSKLDARVQRLEAKLPETAKQAAQQEVRQHTSELVQRLDAVTNTLAKLEHQAEASDRSLRSASIMLYDLPESADQAPHQQAAAALRSVQCASADRIVTATRIGKLPPPPPRGSASARAKPRPVKVTFTSSADVYDVFKKSKDLRRKKIAVDKDLTPQQRALRKTKMPAVAEMRQRGFVTLWIDEKLFFIDKRTGQRVLYTGGNMPPASA